MTKEQVNDLDRYEKFNIPILDILERVFGKEKTAIFCELTAFKYQMTVGIEDCAETDLAKRDWYLRKVEELEGGSASNASDKPGEQAEFDPKSGEGVLVWLHNGEVSVGRWDKECHLWSLTKNGGITFLSDSDAGEVTPIPKPAVSFLERTRRSSRICRT